MQATAGLGVSGRKWTETAALVPALSPALGPAALGPVLSPTLGPTLGPALGLAVGLVLGHLPLMMSRYHPLGLMYVPDIIILPSYPTNTISTKLY